MNLGQVIENRQVSNPEREYEEKNKYVSLVLRIITEMLSGKYCCFGVFDLYQDSSLQDILNLGIRLCTSISDSQLLPFPKTSSAYFGFMEALLNGHIPYLLQINGTVDVLVRIQKGLDSFDSNVSNSCANALNHFCDFFHENTAIETPFTSMLVHLQKNSPSMFFDFITTIFNSMLCQKSPQNQWTLSLPLLGLILSHRPSFEQYKQNLIAIQQTDEDQQMLIQLFNELTEGISDELSPDTKEEFIKKFTVFKTKTKQFLIVM
eukprot:TRINITY_DN31606_c0_g1_i1.p1 TRINITY_DN31606_c0_g1~~TRINITY_DN31606_c0_g1_i1.p1  ORF type:complete len:263 (-),score=30.27 TRINITY_DN31606_c0_g1_i1:73-861(-)